MIVASHQLQAKENSSVKSAASAISPVSARTPVTSPVPDQGKRAMGNQETQRNHHSSAKINPDVKAREAENKNEQEVENVADRDMRMSLPGRPNDDSKPSAGDSALTPGPSNFIQPKLRSEFQNLSLAKGNSQTFMGGQASDFIQRKCIACEKNENEVVQRNLNGLNRTAEPTTGKRGLHNIPDKLLIQAKLVIGAVDDKYEQEADRVADEIVSLSPATKNPAILAMPKTGTGPVVRRKREDDESQQEVDIEPLATDNEPVNTEQDEDVIQLKPAISAVSSDLPRRKRDGVDTPGQLISRQPEPTAPGGQLESASLRLGGGRPLSHRENDYFAPRFGRNLDHVRLHAGGDAQRLSRQMNARAFTMGRNIAFAQGEFQPNSLDGKRLIAHELTHVFQQQSRQLIQRAPLSDEKKQQLRITASKFALDDLSTITEKVENLPDAERKKLIRQIEETQAAAKNALSVIENSQTEHKTVFSNFITKWSAAYDYEPYAYISIETNSWILGGRSLAPKEFIKLYADKNTTKKDPDIDEARALTQSLSNPRQHLLNLFASFRLEQIMAAEKISREDFFTEPDEEGGHGGVFVSPTASELVDQIEDQTAEELSDDKKRALSEMDENKLKLIMELMKQDGSDLDSASKKLESLSELELEVLSANMMLNEGKTKAEGITLNLSDLQDVTKGGGASALDKKLQEIKKLEQSIIDKLKSSPEGKKKKPNSNFNLLEKALKSFEAEIVMMKGLLRGAAKRNTELSSFELELGTAFEALMKEVQAEMTKSLVLDAALSLIPYVGLIRLMRKIQKIIDLIAVIRKALAVKGEIAAVQTKLNAARSQFEQVQQMIKKSEQFDPEDIEEKIFELIEQNNLGDILYLPEMDGLSDEDAREKIMGIMRDIPLGIELFSHMSATYKGLPGKPDAKDLSLLGLRSLKTGVALSPVVAYLALKLLENIDAAKALVGGKSIWDRITKRKGRKSKSSKKSAKDKRKAKKDKSDKKRKKLDTRNVDYIKSEIESVITSQYKPAILAAVEDSGNSLGNHSWTTAYFQDFVKDEVKKINKGRTGISVKTWKKPAKKKGSTGPKVATKSPMLSVKVSFKMSKTPWTIVITSKKVKARVEMRPTAAKVKKMGYDSFNAPGIPFDINVMTGGDKPNRRRKINSWLIHRKQGYQWTYGVDSAGNELRTPEMTFIRMKDGATKPGYIRIAKGHIVKGIDPNAYKHFLGKKLSGAIESRVRTRQVNKKLPPGYAAKKRRRDIVIYKKAGSGATQGLNWDGGLLALGKTTRQPKIVNSKQYDESTTSFDSLSAPQIDSMIDNMFSKDSTGIVKTPEKIDNRFKAQSKPSRKHWKDYITTKAGLRKRPRVIHTDLGYTVNVNRKSLTSFHLPELKKSDDKGHLIAARFSGANNANKLDKLSNLVPMNSNLNQSGAWQSIEREMAQTYIGTAARAGDYVNVKMTLNYNKFVRRPDSIDVEWAHNSGAKKKTSTKTVTNP